jgi:uncharacterized protein YyaL (SSP411 family)
MSPDKKPFFAGTYFPKESRSGRIGMVDQSRRVKELWITKREEVIQSAEKVFAALKQIPDDSPGDKLGKDVPEGAYQQLAYRFDEKHGGFGDAPKFPTAHNLLFLLRYWKRTGEAKALKMVERTLEAMCRGGIYDHVGFGFHRYATDDQWLVPHFEKMLYDQAMLAMTYVEAYQATAKPQYAETATEIFAYVLRDMKSPSGAFYSAEDADSEGEEGKFYVWKLEEVHRVLDLRDAELMTRVFNLWPAGNFHEEATGKLTGNNILHLKEPLEAIAARLGMTQEDLDQRFREACARLFAVRDLRIHPHKDDKILTDWNGLMIAALAKGAQALDRPEYAQAATKAADFILAQMSDRNGRLLHRFRDGQSGLPAHVDDYAFFIWGLLELYEATFETRFLRTALELNREFLRGFWDAEGGGFFFTAEDSSDLILRRKEVYDGATPSGNSVAALNLLRLGRISGNVELEQRAERINRAFAGNVRQFPSAYTQMLVAVEFALGPSHEVVVAGKSTGEDTQSMIHELRRHFLPNKIVVFRGTDERPSEIEAVADYTKQHLSLDGKATAYVCVNYSCEIPTTDASRMLELLGEKNP